MSAVFSLRIKRFLAIFAVLVATIFVYPCIASAEWIEVKTANPDVHFYFEPDTIQQVALEKYNYKVKIKHTFSAAYAAKMQGQWSSVATLESTNEFNLNEDIARTLSFAAYDKNGKWILGDTRGAAWKKYNEDSPYGHVAIYILSNKEEIDTRPKY